MLKKPDGKQAASAKRLQSVQEQSTESPATVDAAGSTAPPPSPQPCAPLSSECLHNAGTASASAESSAGATADAAVSDQEQASAVEAKEEKQEESEPEAAVDSVNKDDEVMKVLFPANVEKTEKRESEQAKSGKLPEQSILPQTLPRESTSGPMPSMLPPPAQKTPPSAKSSLTRGGTFELDSLSLTASELAAASSGFVVPLQRPQAAWATPEKKPGKPVAAGCTAAEQTPTSDSGSSGGPNSNRPAGTVVECALCPEARVSARSKYCAVHKRVADNLNNSEKRIVRLHGEGSSQHVSYKETWKNASESVRNRAILEYLRQYPDGKGKAGMRRGNFDFSEFQHRFVVSASKGDGETDRKLDYEAFVKAMQEVRGWDAARSDSKWHVLLRDPSVDRDQGGPEASVRLVIPSSLVAGGFVQRKREVSEQKDLSEHKRMKLDTPMEVDEAKGELSKGFSQSWTGAASSFMCDVLPRTAMTAPANTLAAGMDATMAVLTEVGAQMGLVPSGSETAGARSSAPGQPEATEPSASQALTGTTDVAKADGKVYDIVSERTAAYSKMRRTIEKEGMDLADCIQEAGYT